MKLIDPHKIVISPVITEKATDARELENKYMFYVHPDAGKADIKRSIEKLFEVDVEEVHTQNVLGKPMRRGRFVGRKPLRKKAIVKVKAGQRISIFEGLM